MKKEIIANPGAIQHEPGSVPKFLYDQGANVIVSGGMGGRAIQNFEQYGIEVILGATGPVDNTINKILDGTLKSGVNIAHPDGHHRH